MLSSWFLDCFVVEGVCVTGLSQISSFFSSFILSIIKINFKVNIASNCST